MTAHSTGLHVKAVDISRRPSSDSAASHIRGRTTLSHSQTSPFVQFLNMSTTKRTFFEVSFLSLMIAASLAGFGSSCKKFRKLLQISKLYCKLSADDTIQVVFGLLQCFVVTLMVSVLTQRDRMFDQRTNIHHGLFHRSRELVDCWE